MWGFLGNLASLAGIIGVSFGDIVGSPWKGWTALATFIACLAFITWRAFLVLKKFSTQHYPLGYVPLSSFARFTTSDGKRILYENFRHLQIKTPYLKQFVHKFNWSGTKDPVITSDIQAVSTVRTVAGRSTREVTLTFPRARMFNDVEVIHTKMEIDDSDGKSQPFLSMRVTQPVRVLSFRVELLHATKAQNGKRAVYSRTSIDTPNAVPEQLGTIPFDAPTKSYTLQVTDPDPGWEYMIQWEKPNRKP